MRKQQQSDYESNYLTNNRKKQYNTTATTKLFKEHSEAGTDRNYYSRYLNKIPSQYTRAGVAAGSLTTTRSGYQQGIPSSFTQSIQK